jgi:hypothetical protein
LDERKEKERQLKNNPEKEEEAKRGVEAVEAGRARAS